MTVQKSNIPSQLSTWSQRGPVAKLKNALRTAEALTVAPGLPVVFQNQQFVIVNRVGDHQLMLRGIDGRHVVADEHDVKQVARPFSGNEGAQSR